MQLLRTILFSFLASTALVNALPTAGPSADFSELAAELAGWLAVRESEASQVTKCDVSRATLPNATNGDSGLTPPSPSLKLGYVALGRGTQNYTCSSSDSTPAAAGAAATLYDASCLAASNPNLLHRLPAILLSLSPRILSHVTDLINRAPPILGHHYFAPDVSTPVFDINDGNSRRFVATRLEGVAAPDDASKGVKGEEYGAVDWLKLVKKDTVAVYASGETAWGNTAYRVVTAGGRAPESCEGRGSEFAIQYAAEYWFYN